MANQSSQWIVISLCLYIAFCVSACLDKLDLEIPRNTRQSLHIESRLVLDSVSYIFVEINTIFDLTPGSFFPVNVRSVHLLDGDGGRIEIPLVGNGYYRRPFLPDDDFPIVTGQEYGLEILTQQDDLIRSSFDRPLTLGPAASLSAYRFQKDFIDRFEDVISQDFIGVDIEVPFRSADLMVAQHFRCELERTFRLTDNNGQTCYLTEAFNLDNEITISAQNLGNVAGIKLPLIELFINFNFAEGYYLNIWQESLSEYAYQYWNSIHQVLNRTGNMFETPAGKIRSNFTYVDEPDREIFGIFYATERRVTRLYLSPDFADHTQGLCPPPAPATIEYCDNCLSKPRSQLNKPPFWKAE